MRWFPVKKKPGKNTDNIAACLRNTIGQSAHHSTGAATEDNMFR